MAVERYDETSHQPAVVAPVSGHELDVMWRQAEMLAQSSIVPSSYRRNPSNILAAAMTGRTFGWDVMTAMRNGHVIEGTWSLKPEAMLALVRQAGHSVSGETSPQAATVTGRRRDTGDEMTVTFSLTDAQRAGLANKGTWKQYPQAMCWARAVSQLCRMLFPDVTLGLSYTPEELGAEVDESGDVIDVAARQQVAAGPPVLSPDNVARVRERCEEAGAPVDEIVRRATDGRTDDVTEAYASEVPALRKALEDWHAERPFDEAEVVEVTPMTLDEQLDQADADAADMDGAYR